MSLARGVSDVMNTSGARGLDDPARGRLDEAIEEYRDQAYAEGHQAGYQAGRRGVPAPSPRPPDRRDGARGGPGSAVHTPMGVFVVEGDLRGVTTPRRLGVGVSRAVTDAELDLIESALAYTYGTTVRGCAVGRPVRVSADFFVAEADTSTSPRANLAEALWELGVDLPHVVVGSFEAARMRRPPAVALYVPRFV